MWSSKTALIRYVKTCQTHNGTHEHHSYKHSWTTALLLYTHMLHSVTDSRQRSLGPLEAPDGTICCNWGNLQRHSEILMRHSGLQSRTSAMKYYKCCHSWANSEWISVDSIELHIRFLFISHCIVSICFCSTHENSAKVFGYPWHCPHSLPSKDVTYPVDVLNDASSAANSTNYTRKSFLHLSGSCPCGPGGSQGCLAASSWHG